MKIAVIGANGKAGRLIVQEVLDRGHEVMAIVRDRNKVDVNLNVLEKDILSLDRDDLKDLDVLINAMGAGTQDRIIYQDVTIHMIELLMDLPKLLYLVVGGAGSLFTDATLEYWRCGKNGLNTKYPFNVRLVLILAYTFLLRARI